MYLCKEKDKKKRDIKKKKKRRPKWLVWCIPWWPTWKFDHVSTRSDGGAWSSPRFRPRWSLSGCSHAKLCLVVYTLMISYHGMWIACTNSIITTKTTNTTKTTKTTKTTRQQNQTTCTGLQCKTSSHWIQFTRHMMMRCSENRLACGIPESGRSLHAKFVLEGSERRSSVVGPVTPSASSQAILQDTHADPTISTKL